MKRLISFVFIIYSQLVLADPTSVGSFTNDQNETVELVAEVLVVQGDEKFLVPRGNNFVKNSMVSLDPDRKSVLELIGKSETEMGGLLQPNPEHISLPKEYSLKWFVDEVYKVKGYGFALDNIKVIPGTNIQLYDSEEVAEARIQVLKKK